MITKADQGQVNTGLANNDGSTKTECDIHVAGAEKTFDRDLWQDRNVKEIASSDEALEIDKTGKLL